MSKTPENYARRWRDLASELTPEQVEFLEEREGDPDGLVRITGNPRYRVDADILLLSARRYAGDNLAAAMIDDVPDPVGAVKVSGWEDPDTPDAFRLFSGTTRTVELGHGDGIDITIRGAQSTDGCVEERGILVNGGSDDPMTTDAARGLAAALLEAADEIDGWAAQ
ncbi:MAG TPA: hypothetical protein VGC05_16235 [Mycobacterium sp.]